MPAIIPSVFNNAAQVGANLQASRMVAEARQQMADQWHQASMSEGRDPAAVEFETEGIRSGFINPGALVQHRINEQEKQQMAIEAGNAWLDTHPDMDPQQAESFQRMFASNHQFAIQAARSYDANQNRLGAAQAKNDEARRQNEEHADMFLGLITSDPNGGMMSRKPKPDEIAAAQGVASGAWTPGQAMDFLGKKPPTQGQMMNFQIQKQRMDEKKQADAAKAEAAAKKAQATAEGNALVNMGQLEAAQAVHGLDPRATEALKGFAAQASPNTFRLILDRYRKSKGDKTFVTTAELEAFAPAPKDPLGNRVDESEDEILARIEKAERVKRASLGQGRDGATEGPAGAPPAPRTKAEYDALPSGTRYIHPDGSTKIKP